MELEYEDIIRLERQGKILVGVDRPSARRFYTDIPMSEIEEKTGEAPYFEKIVVWFFFIAGPISLVFSIILGFLILKWWGILFLLLNPIIFFIYSSASVTGGARIYGISIILIVSICVNFFNIFENNLIPLLIMVLVFSLWCARSIYCSSTFFLRSFVIRNERAFQYLSDHLVIKHIE